MYRAELTVSGRMAATLPLPAAASGFNVDMAEKSRVSWVIEIVTETAEELALALVLVVLLLGVLEEELLLQAAAARHKASDTDVTTAPFLAT